jgi:hypothetical protein
MNNLRELLEKKKAGLKPSNETSKRGNPNWLEAQQFAEYVGLSTPFVLRLFRLYGKGKVLGLMSWLKDIPNLDKSRYPGLVIWRLKGGQYKNG